MIEEAQRMVGDLQLGAGTVHDGTDATDPVVGRGAHVAADPSHGPDPSVGEPASAVQAAPEASVPPVADDGTDQLRSEVDAWLAGGGAGVRSFPLAAAVALVTLVPASAWAFVEYGQVAAFGGGFDATTDGLVFRYGRDVQCLPWAEIADVRLEVLDSWGKDNPALLVQMNGPGHVWAAGSLGLWGSDDRRLCVSTTLLPRPAWIVAAGLEASLTEARGAVPDADVAADRTAVDRGPGPTTR